MSDINFIFNISQYYFNPYSIAPLLVATLIVILGMFLSNLEKQSYFKQAFIYFCLSSAIWLYSCVLILNARTEIVAFFWAHFLYAGFLFVPASVFHLSVSLTNRYHHQKYLVFTVYAVATALIYFCQNPYFFFDLKQDIFGYYPTSGFLQPLLLIFFSLCFMLSLINFVLHHFSISDAVERQRQKLFAFSFVIMFFSLMDILAAYNLYLYPSGFIAFLGFIICITCFKLMHFHSTIERHAHELEHEVELKTRELSQVVEELRTIQFKLLETGKKSALASLSAGILHQISQPITAIHGFARFMKKEMSETDKFYKPIFHIEEQSVYIKRMLEDLMNLVRHREIKKECIDVNVVIKRAMNLLTDELRIRRVNWDTRLTESLPQVFADEVHLQQIFMNLVINALQSFETMPKGATRYMKITSDLDNTKNEIVITFQDSGPGLSDEDKQVIFEPFFSTKSKALGIGLALCQDLVTEHGGRIEVESKMGEGSILAVRLPVAAEDDLIRQRRIASEKIDR